MKNRLRFLAFGVSTVLLLSACASTASKTDQQGGTDAKAPPLQNAKQSVVVGLVAEPVSTDPQHPTDINTMRAIINVYDTLVGFKPGGFELEARLATQWEIGEGGTLYTFKLRQGVKFHDGTPFNAEAVKFTFDRMLDENHPQYNTGPFPFAKFFFGSVKEVKVTDEHTVQFRLSEPFGPFLNNLTLPTGAIVSPSAVKTAGKDFALKGVGTGPFKVKSWEKGVKLVLEANKEYWGGAPKLNEVIFRPITEDLIRVTELQTGGVDVIADPNPDTIPQLQKDAKFSVMIEPGPHVWWVGLNLSKKPFDDVKVRQAANFAIDRKALTGDILKATGVPSYGPLSPVLLGSKGNPAGYDFNVQKAKDLLKDAGYGSGVKVKFLVPESGSGMQSPVPMATAIQAYLGAVGITAELEKMEWGAFLNRINQGAGKDIDMWALSWMAGAGDPDMVLHSLLHSDSFPPGFNSGYYKNPEVDKLVTQAKQLTNPEQRKPLYEQAYALIAQDAPWLFVDHASQLAVANKRVQGFQLHPSFLFFFKDVSVVG